MDSINNDDCSYEHGQLEGIRHRLESHINMTAELVNSAGIIADHTLGSFDRPEEDVSPSPPSSGRVAEINERLNTLEKYLNYLAGEISRLKEL